jgi:hypothetical protein
LTYREIEHILGVSSGSIMNWVKKSIIKRPNKSNYHQTNKFLNALALSDYFKNTKNINDWAIYCVL